MAEKQVKDYDKFNLRFPDGMRDAIAERAKRNGRSMNSEIVQILEDALNAENTLGEIADKINSVSVPLNVDALVQLQARVIAMQKEIQEKFREQNEKLRELLNKKNPPDGGHNPLLRKFINGKETAKISHHAAHLTPAHALAASVLTDIRGGVVELIRHRRTVIPAFISPVIPHTGVRQHDATGKQRPHPSRSV